MRNLFANLCLLLVSCGAGVTLCEVSLRLFYPQYRHMADAQFSSDATRIWARTPNSRHWMGHPDTGVPHAFYHNNLALRQHRDFREADLATATNIGVFGDSFVENSGMAVQYSFTEPLDYLLNQRGKRFNVLNFGVDGYGPGQSFLHYEYFRHTTHLDHVFYVYFQNDLKNIYETGLFHLDEAGHLARNKAIRSSWWRSLISRLHTSYLVLDASGRLSSLLAETAVNSGQVEYGGTRLWSEEYRAMIRRAFRHGGLDYYDQKHSLKIFRQLIRHWKHVAEHNGSTFSVVLLPSYAPEAFVVDLLHVEDVEVIDLYACFGAADPAHLQRPWSRSPYSFKNDWHWNEAGNRLVAACLYRALEEKTGLPRLSEGKLQEALFQYYAAFGGEIHRKAGGGASSSETAAAIREKYLALEMSNPLKGWKEEIRESVAQPDKRLITSDFDVYLYRNRLLYVREDCRLVDTGAPFFLHMIPVDKRDLRKHGRRQGFDRRQFYFTWSNLRIGNHGCLVSAELPYYPVRYIRTGQYVPDKGRLWEGEGWIDPHSVGEERPKFSVAAGKRLIQSDFDVYINGRQLVYHKAECGPADREAPFFLQVTPTDATVLPPDRVQAEFESLDMNRCTTERRLPAYAIRHIRTGQYTGEGELWEAEFTLDQAGVSWGDERAVAQRIVRSVFDVAFDGQRLIYSKAACRPADLEARFFLHVTPLDETDLPLNRVGHGFDNQDFSHPSKFRVNEFGCTRTARLPAYAIRRIRTGQHIPGKGPLWEGEFAMEQDALGQD